jgi:hypothetical protein
MKLRWAASAPASYWMACGAEEVLLFYSVIHLLFVIGWRRTNSIPRQPTIFSSSGTGKKRGQ